MAASPTQLLCVCARVPARGCAGVSVSACLGVFLPLCLWPCLHAPLLAVAVCLCLAPTCLSLSLSLSVSVWGSLTPSACQSPSLGVCLSECQSLSVCVGGPALFSLHQVPVWLGEVGGGQKAEERQRARAAGGGVWWRWWLRGGLEPGGADGRNGQAAGRASPRAGEGGAGLPPLRAPTCQGAAGRGRGRARGALWDRGGGWARAGRSLQESRPGERPPSAGCGGRQGEGGTGARGQAGGRAGWRAGKQAGARPAEERRPALGGGGRRGAGS